MAHVILDDCPFTLIYCTISKEDYAGVKLKKND
jgi:hypothetical protein